PSPRPYGERVRVRGGRKLRVEIGAAPHPNPLPPKSGEREPGPCPPPMEVLQLILNGLMAGTILAVPAIGLTAIFAVLRFTNFALASHMTVGAFAGFVVNVTFGWPIVASLVTAFVVAGFIGLATDELILKPFRASGFITTAIG